MKKNICFTALLSAALLFSAARTALAEDCLQVVGFENGAIIKQEDNIDFQTLGAARLSDKDGNAVGAVMGYDETEKTISVYYGAQNGELTLDLSDVEYENGVKIGKSAKLGGEVTASEIYFKNENNKNITSVGTQGSAEVTAEIRLTGSGEEKTVTAILAAYSDDEINLSAVDLEDKTLADGAAEASKTTVSMKTGETAKLFVWNTETLRPYNRGFLLPVSFPQVKSTGDEVYTVSLNPGEGDVSAKSVTAESLKADGASVSEVYYFPADNSVTAIITENDGCEITVSGEIALKDGGKNTVYETVFAERGYIGGDEECSITGVEFYPINSTERLLLISTVNPHGADRTFKITVSSDGGEKQILCVLPPEEKAVVACFTEADSGDITVTGEEIK